VWVEKAAQPNAASGNALFWTLIVTFKWELLFWLVIVEVSVIISLLQPLLIKLLITYIINGENAWE
jgi:hypothetical protein